MKYLIIQETRMCVHRYIFTYIHIYIYIHRCVNIDSNEDEHTHTQSGLVKDVEVQIAMEIQMWSKVI